MLEFGWKGPTVRQHAIIYRTLDPFRVRGSIMFPERASAQGSRLVSVGPSALPPGHMPRGWSDLFGMKKYGKIHGLGLVGYKK